MYHHRYPIASSKKSSARKTFLLTGLLIAIALGGLGIWLLRSGFFTLRDVLVSGDNPKLSREIASSLKEHFYFPLSSRANAALALLKQFPELNTLSLDLDIFSKTLKASYTLRVSHFLWCKEIDCYLVDASGVIFAHSEITQASFLTNVQDKYFLDPGPGKKIPPAYSKALLDIEHTLGQKNLKLDHFLIDYVFSIKVLLASSLELRFTLQKPIDDELKNLFTFLESRDASEVSKLHYIDLRVKDRIYYK